MDGALLAVNINLLLRPILKKKKPNVNTKMDQNACIHSAKMESAGSLSSVGIGERGRIVGFDLPPDQRQRLLEMGLTIGAEFEVVRFAPMGDPLEIKVRSYRLSLRKREAAGILIARL